MKVVLGGVLALVVGVALVCGFSYVSAYNFGNSSEQHIIAVQENNRQILAQYGQKVQEAAGVTTILRDDLIKVFTNTLGARYGVDGSKAQMQWIQEQNPNLSAETYLQIQRIVEAGRNDFQRNQTLLVDAKRSYKTGLGSFWQGFWLAKAGYPTLHVGYPNGSQDDYPVISTGRANDAFRNGVEEGPVQLRAPGG